MKFRCLALLLIALLALGACDRFEHDFTAVEAEDFQALVFTPLQNALAGGAASLDQAMSYFSDDYVHNGIIKSEREAWLATIFAQDPDAKSTVTVLNLQQTSATTANVNWKLLITSSTKEVLADSTFVGDTLQKQADKWLIRGNRVGCIVPNPKQIAVVEFFTFLSCTNCPPVEAKLHELQLAYPGQLIYLEHHITPPLMVNGDPTYSYYSPGTVPVTIFGGEVKQSGSSPEILAAFDPLVQQLLDVDRPMVYSDLSYSQDAQTFSGSIKLTPQLPDFDQSDLHLNVVLIEKTSSSQNTQGVNLHNVVRGKSVIDISSSDLNNGIDFSVTCVDAEVPEDLSLVIFAQKRPATFANNATILSGMEIELNVAK
ncbi:MAG TPA: hypothetical protein PL126_01700 [Candidatus Cloacimonadota bacterium]|nr:hypothetical protein [Candidatus Cloacimonadota bacterium]